MKQVKKMKNYSFQFDRIGVLLFGILMLPTFFWTVFPAANDLLRVASKTPQIDFVAAIIQVVMVFIMCSLTKNKIKKNSHTNSMTYSTILCCLAYYISWLLYYRNITTPAVIMALTLFPSLAFLSYQFAKQNWLAVVPTLLFTALHCIHGIVNFM